MKYDQGLNTVMELKLKRKDDVIYLPTAFALNRHA